MSMMVPVLVAASLIAWEPSADQDGVVATAPANAAVPVTAPATDVVAPSSTVSSVTQPLTTAQQIDRWVGQREDIADAPVWRDTPPRDVTGEVNLGIGTGDYSHASAYVNIPFGENGTVSLGFSRTKNGFYERPFGRDGLFWSPQDEWAGPQWVTPSGRSYSPLERDRSLISRPTDPASGD